jgi:hypothetical protein
MIETLETGGTEEINSESTSKSSIKKTEKAKWK